MKQDKRKILEPEQIEIIENYSKGHPVDDWDDEMILYLYKYLTQPESVYNHISDRVFTNAMQKMCSFNRSQVELFKMRQDDKIARIEQEQERIRLEKEEEQFYKEVEND